jgi:hypothetical protein
MSRIYFGYPFSSRRFAKANVESIRAYGVGSVDWLDKGPFTELR